MEQFANISNLQNYRDRYIRLLDESVSPTLTAKELSDDLFALDLTVYSAVYNINSLIYNSFAQSKIDENICLHPEQLNIVNLIDKNEAIIISAPTSFGKTYSIFEYIAQKNPSNIVLVVPTLALVDEYLNKIVKKYSSTFSKYKIYTTLSEDREYNFNDKNIFLLTHDRIVNENAYSLIKKIDFLVIDEVYKLEKDLSDDRVLVLNLAYYYLSKFAQKYVLLAPFINYVEDCEKLEKKPIFYKTNYSPVINDVIIRKILNSKERNITCLKLLDEIDQHEKTLIYFPTVTGITKFIRKELDSSSEFDISEEYIANSFIEWACDEVHEDWYLIKAMKNGFLVHNGQLPLGIRMLQLSLYEESDLYFRLLCTSTLLEGVNTTAKNIIITQPSRGGNKNNNEIRAFSDFDFYNLVGRTGRLNQHFLGKAYYIKAPNDPTFSKENALRSIKFELTDESEDIEIQKGIHENNPIFIDFINKLNMTYNDYINKIGGNPRFSSVLFTYNNYCDVKNELINELNNFFIIPKYGRNKLIALLYFIAEGEYNKLEITLINQLINKQRRKLKTIINGISLHQKKKDIDYLITTALKIKNSYIEFKFFSRVNLVKLFLTQENVDDKLIEVLNDRIIYPIEFIYYSNSKAKKMLLDMGIYERDIPAIIKVIGEDFEDNSELRLRLKRNYNKLNKVSYLSKYVINKLL